MLISKDVLRRVSSLLVAGVAALALSVNANAATPEEIKAKGTIQVGVLTDYPPFGGTDAQMKPAGYDVNVAQLLAKSLGVKLELVPITSPNRIPFLLTNKIDVLIATFGITAERSKQVLFSNPYSALTIYLLAPKNVTVKSPDDLKNLTISVARASTQDTALSAIVPPGTALKRYDDGAIALQALIAGQVQAIGCSDPVLAQLNKDYPQLNMEPKLTLGSQANGIAFRKADVALQEYTNKFIAEVEKSGELNAINQRWFGIPLAKLPPMPAF